MSHPVFARVYARRSVAQAHLQEENREELLAGLSGRVLELGCGNGLNFPHYPPDVTEVVGVEPEDYLCRQARLAPSTSDPRFTVLQGHAENVSELVVGKFDAAVFSLVLCSVANPRLVLRETKSVLRDGASVRFYEHVLSDDARTALLQRAVAPLWSAVAGGCRPDRDTLSLIRSEFVLLDARSFDVRPGGRLPTGVVAPHILARGVFRPV